MQDLERLLTTALRDLATLQQNDPLLHRLTTPTRIAVSRGLRRARAVATAESIPILIRTAHVAARMLRDLTARSTALNRCHQSLEQISARFDIAPAVWRARVGS